jgi:hypothetical protein
MDNKRKLNRMCFEKVAFISKDEAKREKHFVHKRTGQKLSVYQCPHCRCWHFTRFINQD